MTALVHKQIAASVECVMCYELGPLGSCPLSVRGFFPQSSDKTLGPAFSRTQCTIEIVVITGKYFYRTSLKLIASNEIFSKGNYLLPITHSGLLTPELRTVTIPDYPYLWYWNLHFLLLN